MLGAEHGLADRQRALEERRSLGVSRPHVEITAGPVQKGGPVGGLRRSVEAPGVPRQDMRRELGAQRP
jgi:hypothetical protein